jgi:predicted naringenin-chalcone synthase
MGAILMKRFFNKKFIITASIVLILMIVGVGTYFTWQRLIPTNLQSINDDQSQKSSAEKSYNNAIDAEKKNDYSRAIQSYQKSLPYYKEKSSTSIEDMNQAYNIEARIKAITAHIDAVKKAQEQSKAMPNVQFSE